MSAEIYFLETIPTPVEAMQFDGTIETAQEILKWAGSENLRAVIRGTIVSLEIQEYDQAQNLVDDCWIVKQPDGELHVYTDSTLAKNFRPAP